MFERPGGKRLDDAKSNGKRLVSSRGLWMIQNMKTVNGRIFLERKQIAKPTMPHVVERPKAAHRS